MKGNFPQSVLTIEPKISDLEELLSRKKKFEKKVIKKSSTSWVKNLSKEMMQASFTRPVHLIEIKNLDLGGSFA